MTDITDPDLILLDVAAGADKEAVIGRLSGLVARNGRADSAQAVQEAVLAREAQSTTGLPGGVAIPHCRSTVVQVPTIAFARLNPPVDFGAPEGPADLVFLIAAPEGSGTGGEGQLSNLMFLIAGLARSLVRPEFPAALRAATTPAEVVTLIEGAVRPGIAPAPAAGPAKSIVVVTACPTGIAHTYIAADALRLAGERAGVEVTVETQGSLGGTPIAATTIAAADAVIFATDVGVKDRERFAGKPVVASGVRRAISEPAQMIAEAVAAAADPNAAWVEGGKPGTAAAPSGRVSTTGNVGAGTRLRQILLTGVSYMIPFVAAGGLLIALGFLLAGYDIANTPEGQSNSLAHTIATANSLTNLPSGGLAQYLGAVLFTLGGLAFGFLVPALAGYIAYAIADRPGLAPGFTAGAVAVFVGAGFIGGIVGGLIAGFAALWISRWRVPQWSRGLMPVAVIPLLATLIVGLLMFLLLGRPLAAITTGLTHWLTGLSGGSVILLGIVLGLMMCFDLGGPVNKAAYTFATAGLNIAEPASLRIMAAVMAAGMVPPLAMALATVVRPGLFSEPERESGRAAWLLGASFISEGAIPFAAADPLRVIPSMMAGGAVTGALIMAFDVTLKAPHGGIFVFFAIGKLLWFLVALAAGTAVGALAVVTAKQLAAPRAAPGAQTAVSA